MQTSEQLFTASHADNSRNPLLNVEKRFGWYVVTPRSFVEAIQAYTNDL